MKTLELPSSLTTSLASGHPWVYRDHVGSFSASSGSWIQVKSGSFSAIGLWDDESAIAVRIFTTGDRVDDQWIERRIADAFELRAPLRRVGVTGYRLVFGEADGLPGIVVDMYDSCAVLVTYAKSLGKLIHPVAQAVQSVTGCDTVVRRWKEGDRTILKALVGSAPQSPITIVEHGMRLRADLWSGQKTGLFFDHRDNRRFIAEHSKERSVLNLYSYTGGFTVAAALGGASEVTSVDIAGKAVAACDENLRLNGLEGVTHHAISQDVFAFLNQAISEARRYDLVICDPPSFAKNRSQLRAAEKAYRRLFALVFRVVRPGGALAAASCTSQVGPQAFRLALGDAARKAKKRFTVVHDVGQPLDHPVLLGHEEGRYLKFVFGRVGNRI